LIRDSKQTEIPIEKVTPVEVIEVRDASELGA